MRKICLIFLITFCTAFAQVSALRIKDLARVEGVDENHLTGIGLVVGLAGTGDSRSTVFTSQMLANILSAHGLDADGQVRSRNIAAVSVTASLPPFAKAGDKIDLVVSSLGDARSLVGGVLLATSLFAADGQQYALGQGPLVVGGFSASGRSSSVSRNHLTVGRIPGGGTVLRDLENPIPQGEPLRLVLRDPDFTTAVRISQRINDLFPAAAKPVDAQTVECTIPEAFRGQPVDFISQIEQLPVVPDQAAKIVVDERTGAIVIGGHVAIGRLQSPTGNYSSHFQQTFHFPTSAFQPRHSCGRGMNSWSWRNGRSLVYLPATTNVEELVSALNSIGAGPRTHCYSTSPESHRSTLGGS